MSLWAVDYSDGSRWEVVSLAIADHGDSLLASHLRRVNPSVMRLRSVLSSPLSSLLPCVRHARLAQGYDRL